MTKKIFSVLLSIAIVSASFVFNIVSVSAADGSEGITAQAVEVWRVTYNLNGAQGTAPIDATVYSATNNRPVILGISSGSAVVPPAGKEFVGWTPVKALADIGHPNEFYAPGKTIVLSTNAASLHGVELFACWKDIETGPFTVEFRTKVSTLTVASQVVAKGGKVTKPADPVYPEYKFLGWYSDSYFREEYKWDFDTSVVTKPTTLHAKWEEDRIPANVNYTVTYHLSDDVTGTTPASQKVDANNGEGGSALVSGLVAGTVGPDGKVFVGWCTTPKRILELMPGDQLWVKYEGIHLYDVWEDANPEYSNATTVNFNDVKQRMTGLGDSIAFHRSARYPMLENKFNDAGITGDDNPARKLVELAIDPEKGIGMNVWRIIIGDGGIIDPVNKTKWGNQYTDGPSDTIWPEPGEENLIWVKEDWENHPELVAKFDEDQMWYLREAMKINPNLRVNAASWSAPYWMKNTLNVRNDFPYDPYPVTYHARHDVPITILEDEFYDEFAKFFVEYAWGMYAWLGIPIYSISPTNEPEIDHPYSGMVIHGDDYERFLLDYLKPEFEKAIAEGRFAKTGEPSGAGTGYGAVAPIPLISAPEGTRIDRSTSPVDLGTPDRGGYGAMMAKEEIQDFVDIFGTHVYEYTQFRYVPQVAEEGYFYPEYMNNYSDIWMNEISRQWSTYGGGVNDINMRNGLHWARLINNLFASEPGFSSYQFWFGVTGGLFNTLSVGTNSYTGQITISKRFFTYAQYSRFINDGDYRVGVSERVPFKGGNITAYKDGDDFSIVVLNEDFEPHTITIALDGNDADSIVPYRTTDSENVRKLPAIGKTNDSFTVTLPPLSITTFVNDKGDDNLPGLDIRDASFPISAADNDGQSDTGVESSGDGIEVSNGGWIKYSNFNFADGTRISSPTVNRTLRMGINAAPIGGGKVEVRIDGPTGKLVGLIDVPKGAGSGVFYTQIDVGDTAAYGFHDVYFVFKGGAGKLFSFDTVSFDSQYNEPKNNVIVNGAFAAANIGVWSGSAASVARATSPAYRSGTGSLLVSNRQPGSGAVQTITGLVEGNDYKLDSFFVPPIPSGNITNDTPYASTYAECGDAEVSLLYYAGESLVGEQLIATRSNINTLDWNQVGAVFTYSPPDVEFDTVKIQFATTTADNFYLANVSLAEYDDDSVLSLKTAAHNIKAGDYFNVNASFKEEQSSNAIILKYTFDGDKFEYANYTPVGGVTVVDAQYGDGWATITLMVPNYKAKDLGDIMLRAKEDATLKKEHRSVWVDAEYVIKDEAGAKVVETAAASTSFTTLGDGTGEPAVPGDTNNDRVIDIIDLSNMIDWFGINRNHKDWNSLYTFFDFNNNGQIDIYDIGYVAKLIN